MGRNRPPSLNGRAAGDGVAETVDPVVLLLHPDRRTRSSPPRRTYRVLHHNKVT